MLTFEPGEDFVRGGRPGVTPARCAGARRLARRADVRVLAGLALVIPGLLMPAFSRVFVDDVLVEGLDDWLALLVLAMGLTSRCCSC